MMELLTEVLREITAQPAVFIAEVAQFFLLLGILVWAVPRFVGKRLIERRAGIAAELAEAEKAEKEYAGIKKEAGVVIAQAEREAPEIIRTANETAGREREAAMARAEAEAKEILLNARQTVEEEKNRVIRDASEHLVGLTTETTRRYLDDVLTEGERRALTQKIVLESLDVMESGSVP